MFMKNGVCRYCGATLKSRKSLSNATIKLINSHAKNGGRVDGSEPMAKVLFVPNLSNWGEIRSHQLDHKRRWSTDLIESCNFCNHCKGSGDHRYFHGKEEKIAHLEEMSALAREFYLRGNLKCDSLAINNFVSCIHDELSEVRSHS
jgi:hypothetical protein